MRNFVITILYLLVFTMLSIAQQKAIKNKKQVKTPEYYYVVLSYYDYNYDKYVVISDIEEPINFNDEIEARITDAFEKSSDPFGNKHFSERRIYKFYTYRDASFWRHRTLDTLDNNKRIRDLNFH